MTTPEDNFEICTKRQAILGGTGHMLVQGGPGSGKTTIALLKARRTVLEQLRPEQSVLFLSFSNAAIRRIIESSGAVLALDISRQVEIKTYHSFAWDILRSHGYLLSSQRSLSVVGAHDAEVLRVGMDKPAWNIEQNRLFEKCGRVTYDQFAPRTAELLEKSSFLRDLYSCAYPLILVDEFQDTDEDQWRLVRLLSEGSDIIALGDTEQRIYDWRDGFSDSRLEEFAENLNAKIFDFQNENNRSPATGIAGYARSLLSPETQLEFPDNIVFKRFRPGRFLQFAYAVHGALINTWNETVNRTGRKDNKIAIAAYSRRMVRSISDALAQPLPLGNNEPKSISHDVMFDQTQIILAARVLAFMLASQSNSQEERLSGALDRISDVFRSSGKPTTIQTSDRLRRWAEKTRAGKTPGTKCVNALSTIYEIIDGNGFSGSPRDDWLMIRRVLDSADVDELKRIGGQVRYLRLLRRGSAIEDQLAALWIKNGNYAGAEAALDEAILQDQLTENHREASGISVMTMHQLKGREFDAVLLIEDQHRTFRGYDNLPPYMKTRRLLQVSLTRARHFAYILSAQQNATLDVIFQN